MQSVVVRWVGEDEGGEEVDRSGEGIGVRAGGMERGRVERGWLADGWGGRSVKV